MWGQSTWEERKGTESSEISSRCWAWCTHPLHSSKWLSRENTKKHDWHKHSHHANEHKCLYVLIGQREDVNATGMPATGGEVCHLQYLDVGWEFDIQLHHSFSLGKKVCSGILEMCLPRTATYSTIQAGDGAVGLGNVQLTSQKCPTVLSLRCSWGQMLERVIRVAFMDWGDRAATARSLHKLQLSPGHCSWEPGLLWLLEGLSPASPCHSWDTAQTSRI